MRKYVREPLLIWTRVVVATGCSLIHIIIVQIASQVRKRILLAGHGPHTAHTRHFLCRMYCIANVDHVIRISAQEVFQSLLGDLLRELRHNNWDGSEGLQSRTSIYRLCAQVASRARCATGVVHKASSDATEPETVWSEEKEGSLL